MSAGDEARDRAPTAAAAGPEGDDAALDELGYAGALAELQAILDELEGGSVDIDVLAARVQRATVLIAWCRRRIGVARGEIEEAVAALEADRPPPA